MMSSDPLSIMVVDDTVTYRRILTDVLEGLDGAKTISSAPQGRIALARLEQQPVDLVLLDLEMPEMDGLETLKEIRLRHPQVAVVMITGENARAARATIQALEQGALDFIRKPKGSDPEANHQELREALRPLLRHVRMRRQMRTEPIPSPTPPLRAREQEAAKIIPSNPGVSLNRFQVMGVGVSTGGPNALREFIPKLSRHFPLPILLVQHMPPGFTASLAEHLDKHSELIVAEGEEGEIIRPGKVYIAPGGRHMVVRKRPAQGADPEAMIIGINDNPPENSCRPSVDVLFRSMAAHYGGDMLAVVMTGMGNDGCDGVRAMKRKGCHCLSQSAESCVVYGMPLAVDEAKLSDEQVPLGLLAERIQELAMRGSRHA